MKKYWFQDEDGSYYRNGPLILQEMHKAICRPFKFASLEREMQQVRRDGLLRKDKLDRGDVVVVMKSFRESYPDKPGLWVLDEREK
jgi:hypothetical protein